MKNQRRFAPTKTGRLAPEWVAAFLRNQWPESAEYASYHGNDSRTQATIGGKGTIEMVLRNRNLEASIAIGCVIVSIGETGRRKILWYVYTIPPSTSGRFSIIRLGPKIERSSVGETPNTNSEIYLPTAGPC